MSFYPSRRHPDTPRSAGGMAEVEAERQALAEWLAHIAAGRIGVRPETPEDIRAVTLANERLICSRRRQPRG